jgi:ClpX C4-type zinc finger
MVLDPELLERARDTGTKLAEADRQALLARADYHTAVRRLHLAGGSLREIAQALGLSHQRVQQIVSGAGGSWWSRVWRTRNAQPDAACTWCGRPPAEVDKLIAGPRVYICDTCVEAAEHVATRSGPAEPFTEIRSGGTARCSFCGKRANDQRSIVTSSTGNVCTECLHVCRDILGGRAA